MLVVRLVVRGDGRSEVGVLRRHNLGASSSEQCIIVLQFLNLFHGLNELRLVNLSVVREVARVWRHYAMRARKASLA